MRKKLDTRFPAARIKKIMQADEDVGKIANAVPLLVSKALELFLQDLCDRTYEVTLQRGAKTMNSLHLKLCVQSYNVFDFLRDIVSKVPDIGRVDTSGEDKASRRRKALDECENESEDESKKVKTQEVAGQSSSGRGRGGGRGRGRGRPRNSERDTYATAKFEDDPGISALPDDTHLVKDSAMPDELISRVPKDDGCNAVLSSSDAAIRNFDLNINLNENSNPSGDAAPAIAKTISTSIQHDDFLGWAAADILLSKRQDEEDEDYDNEDG